MIDGDDDNDIALACGDELLWAEMEASDLTDADRKSPTRRKRKIKSEDSGWIPF